MYADCKQKEGGLVLKMGVRVAYGSVEQILFRCVYTLHIDLT